MLELRGYAAAYCLMKILAVAVLAFNRSNRLMQQCLTIYPLLGLGANVDPYALLSLWLLD